MKIFAFITLFMLFGCAGNSLQGRSQLADNIAMNNMMKKSLVKTDGFFIMSYKRMLSDKAPLNIYIEGDGFAWAAPGRLSVNPTPRNPVALRLASLDNSPNVVYLARPCQYVPFEKDELCDPRYWHGSKYAKIVVKSLSQAIDRIKKTSGIAKINLIGFSGGGGIAAILASLRNDVNSLRTVAGNLDHVAFNNHHKVDQLNDSLNALDFAKGLSDIPQLHISGSKDEIVPSYLIKDFTENIYSTKGCVDTLVLNDVTHQIGWEKHWNELITKPLKCQYKKNS